MLMTLTMMASCFSDDTELGSGEVSKINIKDFALSYDCTAFVHEHLQISPTIESKYDSESLKYSWMLLNKNTGSITSDGDTIQPIIIGKERELDYDVAVAPGQYQLRLIVEAPDGCGKIQHATLSVKTSFSQGFYILKETADGNTELDMVSLDGKMANDLYTNLKGAPLGGAPLAMNITYGSYYINEETDKIETDNFLNIFTKSGQMDISRSSDLKTVFDRSNILFDAMDADEMPYNIICTNGISANNILISSAGLRVIKSSISSYGASPISGHYGLPKAEESGSRWIIADPMGYGTGAYWGEKDKTLYVFNHSNKVSKLAKSGSTELTANLQGFECLHVGYNYMSKTATGTFILEDTKNAQRYLYVLSMKGLSGVSLSKRLEIPSGSHFAKATAYTTNGKTGRYVFGVENNKLWAVNFNADPLVDIEIPLQGIGEGETITLVTDQFMRHFEEDDFDNLIIGTQKGDEYTLYFYEISSATGGVPEAMPVRIIKGKGKVHSLRYLATNFTSYYWRYRYHSFPWTD